MNKQHTTLPAIRRRNHYDVTDRVRISHPDDVCAAVCALLAELHPQAVLAALRHAFKTFGRSEEHTSELQSLMRNSYAVFCLKKKSNWLIYIVWMCIYCTTAHTTTHENI